MRKTKRATTKRTIKGIATIKRVLKRTVLAVKEIQIFSPDEASEFLFFQFNDGNARYFLERNDSLRVRVPDTPHFVVAKQKVSGDAGQESEARGNYEDYLRHSWPAHGIACSSDKLEAKYNRYLDYIERIAGTGKAKPVVLTQIPGVHGYFVVDGNHRCAIAAALSLPVPARVIDFSLAFDLYMKVDEFYGTMRKEMPYQSIYVNGEMVRLGRRNDTLERLALIPEDIIANSTVLDVGCNMGMNAIGAFRRGAKGVVGLEVSQQMVNYATRFAIFDQCYPSVAFRQFDLDNHQFSEDETFDVAFMFSVHDHLKNPTPLIDISRNNVRRAVIFEGHPKSEFDHYEDFFESGVFSRVEKLGDLSTSIFDKRPTRPLWACYK